MADVIEFAPGGFKYVKGVFMYSAGVAALPGFRLERVRFGRVLPMAEGFRRIAEVLAAAGRPNTAFAACELRSPAPFTEEGFRAFNEDYVGRLKAWGLIGADEINPVGRSNVCPEVDPPTEPGFQAFSFTVPDANAAPSFVVAGSGEAVEGKSNYRDHTVALGDTSPSGLREKARYVLGEMERRMGALGFEWSSTTATQVYSVHDIHPLIAEELAGRGAMPGGLTWQFCRPPVIDLEYEMDCRGIHVEHVV